MWLSNALAIAAILISVAAVVLVLLGNERGLTGPPGPPGPRGPSGPMGVMGPPGKDHLLYKSAEEKR